MVHGDYWMGNLLVDGSDLTAVLDWETLHVGEAYEDLAWFCNREWRFGAPTSLGAAGGLGSTSSSWRLRGGQRDHRRSGGVSLVAGDESAMSGRRVCEPEWDRLDLLEGGLRNHRLAATRPAYRYE